MVLKIISTILYVIAGLFLNVAGIMAFVNMPSMTVPIKLIMLCIFVVLALILVVISMALNKFRKWKFAAGIVLISATCVTVFEVISFISMLLSEETRKLFPGNPFDMYNDCVTGFGVIVVFLGLGIILVKSEKKEVAS